MDEPLTHDQLVERIRKGAVMFPNMPGIREAASEVFRPLIEQMRGSEIIYRCRSPWIVRIDRLRVGSKGFYARGTPIQQVRDFLMSCDLSNPMRFGSTWEGLRLLGKSIGLFMLTDHFHTDPAVVAEIKDAARRNAKPNEISQILRRAMQG